MRSKKQGGSNNDSLKKIRRSKEKNSKEGNVALQLANKYSLNDVCLLLSKKPPGISSGRINRVIGRFNKLVGPRRFSKRKFMRFCLHRKKSSRNNEAVIFTGWS